MFGVLVRSTGALKLTLVLFIFLGAGLLVRRLPEVLEEGRVNSSVARERGESLAGQRDQHTSNPEEIGRIPIGPVQVPAPKVYVTQTASPSVVGVDLTQKSREGNLPAGWVLEDDYLVVHHSNGVIAEAGPYLDGVKQGYWSYWSVDGALILEGEYRDGLAEGLWTQWHEQGSLAAKGETVRGQFHGSCSFWHPDGTIDLARSGWYEAGEKVP